MDSDQASTSGARSVVVLGGLRTPFCKSGTALRRVHAAELGRLPAEELLLRTGIDPQAIDEVIFGNVAQPADSANVSRVIALRAGVPQSTPRTHRSPQLCFRYGSAHDGVREDPIRRLRAHPRGRRRVHVRDPAPLQPGGPGEVLRARRGQVRSPAHRSVR